VIAMREAFTVDIIPRPVPVNLFGLTLHVSPTVFIVWGIIAVALVLAVLFRLLVVPRMADRPRGVQMLLEAAVEGLDKYVGGKLDGMGVSFGAYIFSTAVLLVSCALAELLGLTAPTADISMTLALALITFFLINYYGIKKHGVWGRVKSLTKPSALVFPFRVISDLIVPLSMSTRLFGNMFGGMVLIDLLYYAMRGAAIALPSVVGLYFNVFHPLIQAFIFITLTLSYISEATETNEQ